MPIPAEIQDKFKAWSTKYFSDISMYKSLAETEDAMRRASGSDSSDRANKEKAAYLVAARVPFQRYEAACKYDDPDLAYIPGMSEAQKRMKDAYAETTRSAGNGMYSSALSTLDRLSKSIDEVFAVKDRQETKRLGKEGVEKLKQMYQQLWSKLEPDLTKAKQVPQATSTLKNLRSALDEAEKPLNAAVKGERYVELTLEALPRLEGCVKDLLGEADAYRGYLTTEHEALILRVEDVIEYPDTRATQAVKDQITKVKDAALTKADGKLPDDGKVFTLIRDNKLVEAVKGLEDLRKVIAAAEKVVTPHAKAVADYYKKLKPLKPKIDAAMQIAADPKWNTERTKFRDAKTKVIDALGGGKNDYPQALKELTALQTALTDFFKKWQTETQAKVDDLTTSAKANSADVKDWVDTLPDGLITALTSEQQLALLKTLRTKTITCDDCQQGMTAEEYTSAGNKCSSCNGTNLSGALKCKNCGKEWAGSPCTQRQYHNCGNGHAFWDPASGNVCPQCGDATLTAYDCDGTEMVADSVSTSSKNAKPKAFMDVRKRMFGLMELDPKFEKEDKKRRKKLIDKLQKDQTYRDAEKDWKNWLSNNDIAKMEAFLNYLIKEECKVLGHDQAGLTRDYSSEGGGVESFPDVPVKVKLFTPTPAKPGLYGQCEPGFPTFIKLNTTCRCYGDFKEVVDTIIHENSHAFQEMLIKQLKAEEPFQDGAAKNALLNNPDKAWLKTQAQLFAENDQTYVNGGGPAYRHEPLEEHAWTTGGVCSSALLVPREVRSIKSRDDLKNRIHFIERLTIAAEAEVTLSERHGVYVEEWQGEEAQDKKLTLDVKATDGSRTRTDVRIDEVVDAFKLKLNFDSRSLPKRPVSEKEIDSPDIRKLVKKRADNVRAAAAMKEEERKRFLTAEEKVQVEQYASGKSWTCAVVEGFIVLRDPSSTEADVETGKLILDASGNDLT